ncbi:MAG: hypothetical protein JW733_00195 [Coriobacteriia bacterium]|nr:hypothetical protein [Coriobacteriia bacterium]MBN2839440.1 hypothetical protein [Coriobacteriia bacterium]
MSRVRLRCVRVLGDRVDLVLEADPDPAPREVAERAATRLLAWLPGLEAHRCSTGDARTFAEEMRDTETPHLLEHVVLELLRRAGSCDGIRGETVWRKGDDAYLVSIFDDDDALCMRAARLALQLIDAAFGDGCAPDLDAEIARMVALR